MGAESASRAEDSLKGAPFSVDIPIVVAKQHAEGPRTNIHAFR